MPVIPKVLISENISTTLDVSTANITVYYTGTIAFEITANADDLSPTWDSVTLVSGTTKDHTFTVGGDTVRYRIIGSSGATIYTVDNPGIKIKLNY